jgi:hypothetical protein
MTSACWTSQPQLDFLPTHLPDAEPFDRASSKSSRWPAPTEAAGALPPVDQARELEIRPTERIGCLALLRDNSGRVSGIVSDCLNAR